MSSSDLYSYENMLEDWVETLMRYMQRRSDRKLWPSSVPVYWWDDFKTDYPPVAADMEKWLEARRKENQDD